ncbi:MAG TPA: hypothetical protein VNZ05_03755, partial [Solirubrobacteraceae bacterium]|nr:hypothetical protein [Solirubrobacteraceae bacterium]
QAGSETYEPAPQAQQSFAVKRKPQSIKFTSELPKSPRVGGPTYTAAAEATSGLPVTLSATSPACAVSGSTVSFIHAETCTLAANQEGNGQYEPASQVVQTFTVGKGSQTIKFTSPAPSNAVVHEGSYAVTASGGGSSQAVKFTVESASKTVCAISEATVTFIGAGTCAIDANQPGSSDYEAAEPVTQSFAVHQLPQTLSFTSTPPSSALVGGTYAVSAVSTTPTSEHLEVKFFVPTTSVCTLSGSTVTFIAAGICTIEANEEGNEKYAPAAQVQQSFLVTLPVAPGPTQPGPIVPVKPPIIPNSNFKVLSASLSLSTYAITFVESISDPGTFSWVLWFENGKFGVFASSTSKCKAGQIRLRGKCRPAKVLFARGSETLANAGSVTFTVKPTRAGVKALRRAFKLNKGLPVTANVTFQSARGGTPVSRVQSLIVKGRR